MKMYAREFLQTNDSRYQLSSPVGWSYGQLIKWSVYYGWWASKGKSMAANQHKAWPYIDWHLFNKTWQKSHLVLTSFFVDRFCCTLASMIRTAVDIQAHSTDSSVRNLEIDNLGWATYRTTNRSHTVRVRSLFRITSRTLLPREVI